MAIADHSPEAHSPTATSIAAAIGTRRLIAAIVLMPVVAIAATFAIVVYAKARPKPQKNPEQAPSLVLPPDGRVVETMSDGRHVIVRIDAPGGGEIAVFDIGTGQRIRTIKIETP